MHELYDYNQEFWIVTTDWPSTLTSVHFHFPLLLGVLQGRSTVRWLVLSLLAPVSFLFINWVLSLRNLPQAQAYHLYADVSLVYRSPLGTKSLYSQLLTWNFLLDSSEVKPNLSKVGLMIPPPPKLHFFPMFHIWVSAIPCIKLHKLET